MAENPVFYPPIREIYGSRLAYIADRYRVLCPGTEE
jgi:hypothetical protein